MIQLYLDGYEVALKSDVSIKLTRENPYYSKSESYTYDLEIPIAIPQNRKLFGWIDRLDVAKAPKPMSAKLVVDNKVMLIGTANVTKISSDVVSVQLLGASAAYNNATKLDELYVDELDLGDWYTTTWPDRSYWYSERGREDAGEGEWRYYPEDYKFEGTTDMVFNRAMYDDNGSSSYNKQISNLFSGRYPWVAYPVQNASADMLLNGYSYQFTDNNHNAVVCVMRGYVGELPSRGDANSEYTSSGAIQPFVWLMAKKVAEATGFVLDNEDNALYTNTLYRKIFVANASNYIVCNRCMPHWTVNEWWTNVEQMFGVVLSVDYATNKMRLIDRNTFYNDVTSVIHLKGVADEYTTDVDDDEQVDISVDNVGYADHNAPVIDELSEFILSTASINTDFANLSDLLAWANTQGASEMALHKNVVYQCSDGRHYIYTEQKGLLEVDMLRPRLTSDTNKDLDVELKFVPARFAPSICELYDKGLPDRPYETRTPLASFDVQVLEVDDDADLDWYKTHNFEDIDIEAIIDGDEEEGSVDKSTGKDLLYIAIDHKTWEQHEETLTLTNGKTYSDTFGYPRAYIRCQKQASINGSVNTIDGKESLSLIPIEGQNNIASNTIYNSIVINPAVKYCITFIADDVPDITAVFVIHGQKFVCSKLEIMLSDQTMDKLITGYFYELKS